MCRRKKKHFNIAKNTQNPEDLAKYQVTKKAARAVCKKAYNEYIKNIISPESTTNPKRFWGFINSKKSDGTGVAPLKSSDGFTYSDAKSKADLLNKQFSSVFNCNERTDNIIQLDNNNPEMSPITATNNGVKKLLMNLKVHKATGPDGIPARLLKALAHEITPVFTLFFQASLEQGVIPTAWKTA